MHNIKIYNSERKSNACDLQVFFKIHAKTTISLKLDLECLWNFFECKIYTIGYEISDLCIFYFDETDPNEITAMNWKSNRVKCWFWGRKKRRKVLFSFKICSRDFRWNAEGLCLWNVLKRMKKQTRSTSSPKYEPATQLKSKNLPRNLWDPISTYKEIQDNMHISL